MPESPPEPSVPGRSGRWWSIVSGIVGVVGLVAAVIVVVRSARSVKPGPVPVTLARPPADTLGLKLKHNLRTRLNTQERRLNKYRPLAAQRGPEQESLAAQCDRTLAQLKQRSARLDSLAGYSARRALYDSLMTDYNELRNRIQALVRSVDSSSVSDESLENELRRLLDE
ncbi:MAG: hypothetical protein ABIK86_02680 [candidate division WOR-3 bacterium]